MLILDVISDGLRTMFAFLCKYIYELIAILYDLFINISRVEILSSEQIQPIYQRVTMILTIVMVFYVTFEAVKFVVQPEQFSDKEKGAPKIVLKMILVVILIAFVPKIFGWAYDIQNKIFDNQVLSKVILGNKDISADKFGKNIAYNIFSMFYDVNNTDFSTEELEEGTECDGMPCKQVVTINLYQLQREGNIPIIYSGLNSTGEINEPTTGKKVDSYYINFNGLLATLVGGFIGWILLLYCVDVGVRVVQLVFLQIIAPIPIMAYLSPKKDGMFEKWVKQCMTTYLDVFLRLAVIYFILLICEILGEAMVNNKLVSSAGDLNWAVYVALILGLLLFAKKAPDLLKELFPKTGAASGNFGLKAGDRVAPIAARAAGMAIGAGIVGAKGLISSTANKAKRDWKNIKSGQHAQDLGNYAKSVGNTWNKRSSLWQARLDYMQNRGNMTKEQRKAAKEALKDSKQELKDAKLEQRSAKADVHNSKIGLGAVGSGVAGAIGGAVRGATAGAQATDLKGIGKQVQTGLKNQASATARTEKWYSEGGGSNFDRVVTAVEKSLDINTDADIIAKEIQEEEEAIKTNESLINAESDVKKKSDDVESRLTSKLDTDSKASIANDTIANYLRTKTHIEGIDDIPVSLGESMAGLRKKATVKTEAVQAELDRIIKDGGDEAAVNAAKEKLRLAREQELAVKKFTMRAAFTQILQNPTDAEHGADPVAAQKIELLKESAHTARRSADTVRKMQAAIGRIPEYEQADFEAFMSGKFNDYDQLDHVITALQTIVNTRMVENQGRQENKRKLESSHEYLAAKADKSASSGN